MSKDYTMVLRAIAIFMVMQQHLSGFVFGSRLFTPLGGVGVAVFLIISGYGLTVSARENGLNGFWTKKLVRVFSPWFFVWFAMTLIYDGEPLSISSFLSLFLVNSTNWYLQYLLLCYIVFYISHKWFYNLRWLLMIMFFVSVFMLWGNIQAEQSCSFIIGCLIAEKPKLFKWIVEHVKAILLFSAFVGILLLLLKQLSIVRSQMENISFFAHLLNMIMKASLAICSMMLVRLLWSYINRRLAMFVGKMSYELYLVHLFVVIGFCVKISSMPLVSICAFFVGSFLFSYWLYRLDNKILAIYKKAKSKNESSLKS